jgi:hypothetical protein
MALKQKGETGMSETKEMQEQKRVRHIQEMKERLRHHLGQSEPPFLGKFESLKREEEFLEHILFMEGVDEQPLFAVLQSGGVLLPAPATLDDAQLSAKLWEVIHAMALLGHYLSRTDHLSDRQLYERLWTEILPEPTSIHPTNPNAACYIDILGGCSDEDLLLNLKYYADEDERLSWEEEYPEDAIPPHEPLPYDRDSRLPEPPSERVRSRDAC